MLRLKKSQESTRAIAEARSASRRILTFVDQNHGKLLPLPFGVIVQNPLKKPDQEWASRVGDKVLGRLQQDVRTQFHDGIHVDPQASLLESLWHGVPGETVIVIDHKTSNESQSKQPPAS